MKMRSTFKDKLKKEINRISEFYHNLDDNQVNHYNRIFKELKEISEAKIFKNIRNISRIDILFDRYDGNCIFANINILNKKSGKNDFIYIDFFIFRDNIGFGGIEVYPYNEKYEEDVDSYPWERIKDFLMKANTVEEIELLKQNYLKTELFKQECYNKFCYPNG
jgi:hypothetical protein